MKLDPTDLRYLTSDDFRVLTAVEMGSKNHEVVPSALIASIAGLRSGGVNKCLGELARRNLVARVANTKYDGYRMTYGGYDFLACRAFAKRDTVVSVGNQIGVGKESDIYVVADAEGVQRVLKLHRLGRISFRAIKSKRDYLQNRKSASWMYMSRLSATKEYAFMKVLHEHGFPVPQPIDHARHCVVMELIDAFPLHIAEIANPGQLYSSLMDLIVRFARAGLIHGDFNEFNILLREHDDGRTEPIVIDFPQMVSTEHENAEFYFNRDVACIRRFFKRRFRYESAVYPRFSTVVREGGQRDFRLDVEVEASGFSRDEARQLDEYMDAIADGDAPSDEDEEEEGSDELADEDEEEAGSGDELADDDAVEPDDAAAASDGAASELDLASLALDDNAEASTSAPRPRRKPAAGATRDVSTIVTDSIARARKSQQRQHHSRKATSAQMLGKRKGSKARADVRSGIKSGGDF